MKIKNIVSLKRRAAIEMSMGTIVIIVLGVTMLILGMVLVRSVMCSALGLTGDINKKISTELDNYFGENGEEVVCIGQQEPAKIIPDKSESIIYCSINAPEKAEYTFTVKDSSTTIASLSKDTLNKWIIQKTLKVTTSPGDRSAKKVIRIKLPTNAPEGRITLKVQVDKDGLFLTEKDIDLDITRVGFVKSSMC